MSPASILPPWSPFTEKMTVAIWILTEARIGGGTGSAPFHLYKGREDELARGAGPDRSARAIMAKLEKPAAIDNLDAIVALADGIMVARGDLGVELPPAQVPVIQRRIVRACRREGKPVVVATQMLESMTTSPVATRAEASDVATAVCCRRQRMPSCCQPESRRQRHFSARRRSP